MKYIKLFYVRSNTHRVLTHAVTYNTKYVLYVFVLSIRIIIIHYTRDCQIWYTRGNTIYIYIYIYCVYIHIYIYITQLPARGKLGYNVQRGRLELAAPFGLA